MLKIHKMYSLEEKVENFALCTRIGILILQFLANFVIPDHNNNAFQKPKNPNSTLSPFDSVIESAFGGLTRWDAQYFLHITEYGYTYENTLAFFPLFPLIIRFLGYSTFYLINEFLDLFVSIDSVVSLHSIFVIVSVVFNNYIFVKTSKILFRLSLVVLKSEKLAYFSAILFCINPASVFFSAIYSESIYCFLTFYALLKIEKGAIDGDLVTGLTALVRSNGIINIGFLIYRYIKLKIGCKMPISVIFLGKFTIIFPLLPFLSYQFYCYAKYCLPDNTQFPEFIQAHARENRFILPGGNSSWCNQPVPFAYAYVQNYYWNVGFLKYYELKQIPNFLLATPMIYIITRGVYFYVKYYKHILLYLGIVKVDPEDQLPVTTFQYAVHAVALTVFATFMIHVQVATRLLASSSPFPYWVCAREIALSVEDSVEVEVIKKFRNPKNKFYSVAYYEQKDNKNSRWRTFLVSESFSGYSFFIKWYFLSYFFVGTILFSNNLPWT